MRKIFKTIKEHNNAQEIANIYPYTIFYDMLHIFAQKSNNNKKHLANSESFTKALLEQPFFSKAMDSYEYKTHNPQNKVLMHGIMYYALYNLYMKHVKKGFNSVLLSDSQKQYNSSKLIIDFTVYDYLPKKYRGIFVPYDSDNYILNTPYKNLTLAYNKKNKDKLEKLLERAKMLIPVIYKEPTPDADFGGVLQIYEQPAFTHDSRDANRVSDEQLKTILELREIFIDISNITLPIATTPNHETNAYHILDEYINEKKQEDIVFEAQEFDQKSKQEIYKSALPKPAPRPYKGRAIKKIVQNKAIVTRTSDIPSRKETYAQLHNAILAQLQKDLKTYRR
jgi:hypothetical protein